MQNDPAFENNPYLTVYPSIGDEYQPMMPDPCDKPNPPPWCEETPIPIEPGILGLGMMLAFGVALIIKYNEKTQPT